ncbi:hypothetical protein DCC62_00465 [candidate division KSB1 bacterium]|nr:MAG: hypothetical protein DCC62_00465 [candidate division KSB1 bacterium]
MLSKNDVEWLIATYPQLTPNSDGTQVQGVLPFVGAYDKASNKFTLIDPNDSSVHSGIVLFGSYTVSIEKNTEPDRLPRLYVHDDALLHVADRHFYPATKSACVCGIVEEARFLTEGFDFKKYLEEFVIPFLYGQKYYAKFSEWPWRDYAHDTAGVLESYFLAGAAEFLPMTLKRLRAMTFDWERVKNILKSSKRPKGHLPCFCKRHDHIRRCHPDAWEGIKRLYEDIHKNNISVE